MSLYYPMIDDDPNHTPPMLKTEEELRELREMGRRTEEYIKNKYKNMDHSRWQDLDVYATAMSDHIIYKSDKQSTEDNTTDNPIVDN